MQALLARAERMTFSASDSERKHSSAENGPTEGILNVTETYETLAGPNNLLEPALAKYKTAKGQVREPIPHRHPHGKLR
jgi:hypothetical protein